MRVALGADTAHARAVICEGWCAVGVGVRLDARHVQLHDGERRHVLARGTAYAAGPSAREGGDRVVAPMPGRVVLVKVEVGHEVGEGQELAVMEAMKMELSLRAPRAGRVAAVQAAAGDFVEAEAVLIRLEETP